MSISKLYPNPLKERLRRGEILYGSSLPSADPLVAGIVFGTEPDFIWIDTEHTPYGTEALGLIPVLARQRGIAPMIRVAWNDPALIKKAYDSGAVAVMVPQVNTAEEAERAVRYAKYPPEGNRGVAPTWPIVAGENPSEVIMTANEETLLILQIESLEAFKNIDAIKQVPGVDILFAGPLDLSASLGCVTEVRSREVQSILESIPEHLKGTKVVAGTTFSDFDEVAEKVAWGYRFINIGNILYYGARVMEQRLSELKRLRADACE